MSELRSFKPRFNRKRLVAQLRSMDLTPKPMTEKALQQSRELEEEFRVYRERAWNVFTPVEMGGCRPTRPVPVDEAGTFLVRHLTIKGERLTTQEGIAKMY